VHIALGRSDVRMPHPESDHGSIDASLQW
jgi:hypothetical protein